MYDGYLNFGGNEIANNTRTRGYAESATCPMFWFKGPVCEGIYDALGETDLYTYANITGAPWYDSANEASTRFFGVYIVDVEGMENSTRQVSVTEGVGHGGVLGPTRKGVKSVRVKAMLAAEGQDALEYGMAWLSSVLDPGTCGQHGSGCGTVDLAFFADCPPTRDSVRMPFTEWGAPITNLVTNPSMETPGAVAALRTNQALNPSMEESVGPGTNYDVRQNLATNPSFEASTASTVEVRRNIFTNPSFETPATDLVVRTNLATNPSVEATTAATQEIRRNLNNNPRLYSNNTGWATTGSNLTIAPTNGGAQLDLTVASSIIPGIFQTNNLPAIAGEVYSSSMEVTVPIGYPSLTFNLRNHSYGDNYAINESGNVTVGPGETKRIVAQGLTLAAGGATTGVRSILYVTGPLGGRFFMKNAIMEKSSVSGPYFDGNTTAWDDFSYAWSGTLDASQPVQYGIGVPPGFAMSATQGKIIQSTGWAKSGTKSLRIVPVWVPYAPDQGNTFAYIGSGNAMQFLTAGKTYTILATLRLNAPQGGTPHANARRIVVAGDLSVGDVASPNAAGIYEKRLTFTVPAAATTLTLRLYNGASVGQGDAWWDDVLIVEGTYTGPYFDGSTAPKVRRNIARDPSAVSGLGWSQYFPSAPAPVVTLVTGASDGPEGASTYRRVVVTPAAGNRGGQQHSIPSGWLREGEPISASMWVRVSEARQLYVVAQYQGYGQSYGEQIDVPANVWTKLPVSGVVAPSGGQQLQFSLVLNSTTNWTAGVPLTMDAGRVMMEKLVQPGGADFFDGSHPVAPYGAGWEGAANDSPSYLSDSDFTTAWTGTPDASTSEVRAPRVSSATLQATRSRTIQSGQWASNRAKSMRIIPIGGGNDTYAELSGVGTDYLLPGKTYTIQAKVRLLAPLTGTLVAYSRGFRMQWSVAAGSYHLSSPLAPNVAGVSTLSYTFTVPADATALNFMRLYNGADLDGGDVWWDDLVIVEGTYTGPYFDGYTVPPSPDLTYAWAGVADASASVQYGLVAGMAGSSVANLAPVQSTEWARTGTKSLRQIPTASTPASYTVFPASSLGMVAGKTYTVLAYSRLSAPQTPPLENQGRVRQIMIRQGTGGTDVFSAKAPNVAGVTEHRVTAQIMDVPSASVFLWNGAAAGGGDVWWDDLLVIEGVYNGPYFDGSTPAKERRNLTTVPVPTSTYFYNSNNSAYYVCSYDTANVRRPGTASSLLTRLATGASRALGSWYNVGMKAYNTQERIKVTPGVEYTASLYGACSVAGSEVSIGMGFFDAAGAAVGGSTVYGAVVTTSGPTDWKRASVTRVTPDGAVTMGLGALINGPAGYLSVSGERAWITDVLIETGATVGDYFDGNVPIAPLVGGWDGAVGTTPSYLTDPDFTYEWSTSLFSLPELPGPGDPPLPPEPAPLAGTPNASKSNQLAPRPANYTLGGSAVVQSGHWAADRAKSLRIVSQWLTQGSAYSDIAGTGFEKGLVPGKSYVLTVVVRLAAARGGYPPSVGMPTQNAGNPAVVGQDVAGEQTITFPFTVPATGWWYLRLYSNVPMGWPDVWFDKLMIAEGSSAVPYFDGYTLPPAVRTNQVVNPNFGYGSMVGWGSYWSPARALTTANPRPGGNGVSMQVSKATDTHTAQGTNTSQYRGWFALGDTLHAIVRLRAEIGVQLDIGFRTSSGGATGGPLNVQGDGQWHEYDFSMVATPGNVTNGVGLQINVDNSNTLPNNTPMFQVDSALLEAVTTGAYFDPDSPIVPYAGGWLGAVGNSTNILYDDDLTYSWTGTPDASTSVVGATGVETWTNLAHTNGWSADRSFSGRKLPNSVDSDGQAIGVPDQTITVVATVMIMTPGVVAPKIGFRHVNGTVGQTTVDVPLIAGTHEVRLTVTVPSGTTSNILRIWSGDTETWWDKIIVVDGVYGGPYFDGETPDNPPTDEGMPIGTVLQRYEWTGTADASTSTHETGTIISVEDPLTWLEMVTDLQRYLHDTGAVSGPLVTDEFESAGFVANAVEFVFTSERPWVFKATRPIDLPPALPVVVQDIPFNLAPYPNAELSSGTVVVSTNYSTNPSLETDATGWTAGAGTVITPASTGARSTELAAAGAASYKVTTTATNSNTGSGGSMYAIHDVTLPAEVSGQRFSISGWVAALVTAGTAVIQRTRIKIEWRNATTLLLTEELGTGPASGGPIAKTGLVRPAGATFVRLVMIGDLTSWSVGAVINVYADAVAVTIP